MTIFAKTEFFRDGTDERVFSIVTRIDSLEEGNRTYAHFVTTTPDDENETEAGYVTGEWFAIEMAYVKNGYTEARALRQHWNAVECFIERNFEAFEDFISDMRQVTSYE